MVTKNHAGNRMPVAGFREVYAVGKMLSLFERELKKK